METYKQGDLRMRRKMNVELDDNCAYIVEESYPPYKRVNSELLTAQGALLLMRELGSPYKGSRSFDQKYPDKLGEAMKINCECACPLYRGSEWFCIHGQRFVFIPVKRDSQSFLSEAWVRATNKLG